MKIMSHMDEIVYDYYIKNNYRLRSQLNEAMREGLHFFYKGVVGHSDFVQTLESSAQTKLLQNSTKGNLLRAVNALEYVLEQTNETPKETMTDDEKSRFRNKLGSDQAKSELAERQSALGQVESMTGQGLAPSYAFLNQQTPKTGDPIEARRKMADSIVNHKKIRDIVNLYGQLLTCMNKVKRERRFPDNVNIVDVELGRNLSKVILPERLALASEELELLSNYRFATHSMLQYKTEAIKEVSKGDFVILIDTSGSTQNNFHKSMTVLDTEVAFALATIRFALEDGRKAKVFSFGRDTYFLGDISNVDQMTGLFQKLIALAPDGSTNATSALNTCFQSVSEVVGDVMMLTDGEFEITSSLHKKSQRLIAGLIQTSYSKSYGFQKTSPQTLKHFDGYFEINNLKDLESISLELV